MIQWYWSQVGGATFSFHGVTCASTVTVEGRKAIERGQKNSQPGWIHTPSLCTVTALSFPRLPRLMRLTVMAAMLVAMLITLANLAVSNPVQYSRTAAESDRPRGGSKAPTPLQKPPSPVNRCTVLAEPGPCGSGPGWKHGVTLPNLYGHYTVDQAFAELTAVLASLPAASSSSELVTHFLCTLYLPPCPSTGGPGPVLVTLDEGGASASAASASAALPLPLPLPCRPLCELARGEVQRAVERMQSGETSAAGWPSSIRCHMFPTERCYALAGTLLLSDSAITCRVQDAGSASC